MSEPIHPEVRIGHAHLRVSDLGRATDFYRDVLGFEVMHVGAGAAFLSAGGYHHHIGPNTWHSAGGTPPREGHTGLFHIAIFYRDRRELAKAVKRVLDPATPSPLPTRPPRARPYTSTTRTPTGSNSTTISRRGVAPHRGRQAALRQGPFKKLGPKDLLEELRPA